MIEGTLIMESLRTGTALADLGLTVQRISRYRAGGATPGQPGIWATLDFEADEARAEELAGVFAEVLAQPGWYVNFQTPAESFIIFPGRIFRYPRGRGRQGGGPGPRPPAPIPDPQLDWTV